MFPSKRFFYGLSYLTLPSGYTIFLQIPFVYTLIPVFGSFSEKKSEALEYAKMYDNLPHKVEEIEKRRKAAFIAEYGCI